ncbi:neuronal acetylcholine receptor subunit alpha-7-like [Rhopilema esculentum]|uniref:neuronal acetylcholine receptor subunit alpha-7-like n=1 Tax=Rhopilema esculentum TaxID=499914 RepID=UPI0031D1C215
MLLLKTLLLFAVFCQVFSTYENHRQKHAYETLIEDLLKTDRYDNRVRPIRDPSLPINVTISLALHVIENLDERKQVLTSRVELYQSWYDYQLRWNASQYGGIKVISVSSQLVWTPDIFLYGQAEGRFGAGRKRNNAVVNYNGIVTLDYPAIFKTTCELIIDKYPFDSQQCDIRLGSWVYDTRQLKLFLKEPSVNTKHYVPNGEWELKSATMKLNEYNGSKISWDSAVISFHLRRLALYHSMYYLIPCAMIGLMTIIVFVLPVNMNERMTVGLTLLIALSFFFLLMAENLPAIAKTIPIAAKYYTATTVLSAIAYFMTCIVLKCHFSNPLEGDAPNWIRVLVLDWIASIIFMKNKNEADNDSDNEFAGRQLEDNNKKEFKKREMTKEERRSNSVIKNSVRLQATLDGRKEEWNKIAHVLNRLFMILYTSSFLLVTIMLLASAVW